MSDCLCSLCTVRRDGTYKMHCQKCGPGAFLPTPTSIASKSKAHKHCRERGSHNGNVRLSTTLKLTDCRTDYFLVCNWWFTAFVGRSSHQRYMYMYFPENFSMVENPVILSPSHPSYSTYMYVPQSLHRLPCALMRWSVPSVRCLVSVVHLQTNRWIAQLSLLLSMSESLKTVLSELKCPW